MTLTINKAWHDVDAVDGVSNTDDSLEIKYLIHADDNEDESDVVTFLQDPVNVPKTYLGLFKANTAFGRHEDTEDYWAATVTYENGQSSLTIAKLDVAEVRWSIVGGNGPTIKRTYSDALVSETLPSSSTAPALDTTSHELVLGLVHRDGDFEIEGVDVSVGGTQISVETVWDYATAVTQGRLVTAAEYADVHAVNIDVWNGFAAGTLRIETLTIRNRPGDQPLYDVSFLLTYSKNLQNIDIGNDIVVPAKKGHEILDILWAKKEVDSLPLPIPIRAAVHRIHPEISFASVLGL